MSGAPGFCMYSAQGELICDGKATQPSTLKRFTDKFSSYKGPGAGAERFENPKDGEGFYEGANKEGEGFEGPNMLSEGFWQKEDPTKDKAAEGFWQKDMMPMLQDMNGGSKRDTHSSPGMRELPGARGGDNFSESFCGGSCGVGF